MIICNNHTYIGSSINIYYRLKRHTSDLLRNKHSNRYMQNVFNKYGKEKFLFKIIELCDSQYLIDKESHYIDILSPDLNLDLNPSKRIFCIESRQKISNTLREGFKTGRIKRSGSKPVYRYTPEGIFIDQYESCSEASRALGIPMHGISKAASGKANSSCGFIWSYTKTNKLIKRVEQNKTVRSVDIFGNVKDTWISIKALAKSLNLSQSACSMRITKGTFYNGLRYEFYQVPG